ncbi:hypothetical protein BDI01nite_27330 [Brevundimonas diminuta]|nr:hypothetical protein BDI01nite_27330 [Brevundimonas diminuta]
MLTAAEIQCQLCNCLNQKARAGGRAALVFGWAAGFAEEAAASVTPWPCHEMQMTCNCDYRRR